jgi:hypothetical protein
MDDAARARTIEALRAEMEHGRQLRTRQCEVALTKASLIHTLRTDGGMSVRAIAAAVGVSSRVIARFPVTDTARTALAPIVVIAMLVGSFTAGRVTHTENPSPENGTATSQTHPTGAEQLLTPVTAVSRCLSGSTTPETAFDLNQSTAWVCLLGSRSAGIDELGSLVIRFAHSVKVTRVVLDPGWNYIESGGRDHWSDFARPESVTVKGLPDNPATSATMTVSIPDDRNPVIMDLSSDPIRGE